MKLPFIFLRSEVTRDDAAALMSWLDDEEVTKYLSDGCGVSESIARTLERIDLPVLTHLFSRDGRFYMIDAGGAPVGFVRLIPKRTETEIVVVVGEKQIWGKRIGTAAILESLKIAFYELRAPRVVARIHVENRRSVRAFGHAGFKSEKASAVFESFVITMEEYIKSIRGRTEMKDGIIVTETDKKRLKKLISEKSCRGAKMDENLSALEREIERAEVVSAGELPEHIVTMNTRAILRVDGEKLEASLVYPQDADWTANKLSVLSPIGTAILGYGEGADIEWEIPDGTTAISIEKILYQPEAEGDYHL